VGGGRGVAEEGRLELAANDLGDVEVAGDRGVGEAAATTSVS